MKKTQVEQDFEYVLVILNMLANNKISHPFDLEWIDDLYSRTRSYYHIALPLLKAMRDKDE